MDYDNHPLYKHRKTGSKLSPVRLFTNIPPKDVVLPKDEGYRYQQTSLAEMLAPYTNTKHNSSLKQLSVVFSINLISYVVSLWMPYLVNNKCSCSVGQDNLLAIKTDLEAFYLGLFSSSKPKDQQSVGGILGNQFSVLLPSQRFCSVCQRFVWTLNKHCAKCNVCPSKVNTHTLY